MKVVVLSIILLSSFLTGCSTTSKGQNVLSERSAMRDQFQDLELGVSEKQKKSIKNTGVAHAWRHETELPNGDYFWGGWLSLVVSKPQWAERPN